MNVAGYQIRVGRRGLAELLVALVVPFIAGEAFFRLIGADAPGGAYVGPYLTWMMGAMVAMLIVVVALAGARVAGRVVTVAEVRDD